MKTKINKSRFTKKKLNLNDFYDVYGISLLMMYEIDTQTRNFLLYILKQVGKKYINISLHALTAELRYFRTGGAQIFFSIEPENENILHKKNLRKNWGKKRKLLSIDDIKYLFKYGMWQSEYGGRAWYNIAIAVEKLMKSLETDNVVDIVSKIDRLNDLEHNNALYLNQYTTFDLSAALDNKKYRDKTLLTYCSKEIYKIGVRFCR